MMLDEPLPQDLEAERVLLGSVFAEPSSFGRLMSAVNRDDFSIERHKRVWDAMASIWSVGGAIDTVIVYSRLKDSGHLWDGALTDLISLRDGMGPVFSGDDYAKRVKEISIRRRTILACHSLMEDCRRTESREVLERGERLLRDLSAETRQDRRLVGAAEIIAEYGGMDGFLATSKADVPLPWATANLILGGGLRNSELVVIAAGTSVGKTACASQIALVAGAHGIGTAVFSLEMQKRDMLMRMAVCRSGVDGNAVRVNRMSRDQRMAYSSAVAEIVEMPIWFDDSAGSTVPAIHAAVRQRMTTDPVGLVIVDYLQLVEAVGRYDTRAAAVGSLSRGLKLMAGYFGVPVIALSQLNRASEDRAEPELRDLRESGSIEQDANTVIFLHRTDASAVYSDVVPIRLLIRKQRNGPVGRVDMLYHRSSLRFEEAMQEAA